MNVTLEIIEAPAESGLLGQKFPAAEGNTLLGRADSCQISLPDSARIISSEHGALTVSGGKAFFTDSSTNGTGHNSLDTPFPKGTPQALQNGDVLFLGLYQIRVNISAGVPPASPAPLVTNQPASDPLPNLGGSFLDNLNKPAETDTAESAAIEDDLDKWLDQPSQVASSSGFGSAPQPSIGSLSPLASLANAQVPMEDPLALLGGGKGTSSPLNQEVISTSPREDSKWWQEPMEISSASRQPVIDEAFEAPRFVSNASQGSATMESAAVAPSRLSEKLGVEKVAPDALENKVIRALTTVVDRLIGIMRARSSIKNDMRVDRTIIGVSENNPLKFSPTAQDALKLMFGPESPAFMNAEKAFSESILDLEDHQQATLMGVRLAYEQMLRQFSPENIQAMAEASGKNTGGVLGGKKKLWEVYEQYYQQLMGDPEGSYNRLFGEALSRAYEAQLKELKIRRR